MFCFRSSNVFFSKRRRPRAQPRGGALAPGRSPGEELWGGVPRPRGAQLSSERGKNCDNSPDHRSTGVSDPKHTAMKTSVPSTTSQQLPATSYQLPATSYQLPATSYQRPAPQPAAPDHRSLASFYRVLWPAGGVPRNTPNHHQIITTSQRPKSGN